MAGKRIFLLLSMLLASSSLVASSPDDETLVILSQGPLQGAVTDDGMARAFRGVPYVNAPVGPLRFKAPSYPPQPWVGTFNATIDGAGCVQACDMPWFACPPVVSEDCLFVNVFTPRMDSLEATGPTPVMVFFHGGNFKEGYGGSPVYDGRYISNSSSTVVVVVNYRLGVLGFLASSDPTAELPGNYGWQDQVASLKWVQDNIAAFGGDPSRVTIVGQSAGAVSNAIHLYAPASKGLFSQVIMHSEPYGIPLKTLAHATVQQQAFAKFANCSANDIACFRALTVDQILAAQAQIYSDVWVDLSRFLEMFMPLSPVIGAADIPVDPFLAGIAGMYADVPIIMGNTRQEGNLFVYEAMKKNLSVTAYDLLLDVVFTPKLTPLIAQEYPINPSSLDMRDQAANITTDSIFLCMNRNASRIVAQGHTKPVFLYVFDHPLSFATFVWPPDQSFCWNVSCHGEDLPFLFHYGVPKYFNWTTDEERLSASMVEYWTNFMWTGDVNVAPKHKQLARQEIEKPQSHPALIQWPAYDQQISQTLRFVTPAPVIDSFFLDQECSFWDSVGYEWP